MAINDKHNADLLKAKAVLGKLNLPPKDKTHMIKSGDAIEKSFTKAIALAKAQKKLNDQANALKKKYDDFIDKMPDNKAFLALVYKLNDDSSKANDAASKLSVDATKKRTRRRQRHSTRSRQRYYRSIAIRAAIVSSSAASMNEN